MTCGIYGIIDKDVGSIYIGQSTNIERRIKDHCKTPDIDIDIAIKGKENFDFFILEETEEHLLPNCEAYWIDFYNTYEDDKHYNKHPGGKVFGTNNPNAKYSLWDSTYCTYVKFNMVRNNRDLDPCKCFRYKYNGYMIPMGFFEDFISCETIDQLVKDALEGVYNENNNR